MAIRCSECKFEVDEFTAIAEGWRYYSDGCGDLMPKLGSVLAGACSGWRKESTEIRSPFEWVR